MCVCVCGRKKFRGQGKHAKVIWTLWLKCQWFEINGFYFIHPFLLLISSYDKAAPPWRGPRRQFVKTEVQEKDWESHALGLKKNESHFTLKSWGGQMTSGLQQFYIQHENSAGICWEHEALCQGIVLELNIIMLSCR